MQKDYLRLKRTFNIERIYSVHYFELPKTYTIPGKEHDFWEFVYVDKGEIIVTTDEKEFVLHAGEIACHQPMEWHSVRSNGSVAPNIMFVAFRCTSPAMKAFVGKQIRADRIMHELLAEILAEGRQAFSSPLDDPYTNTLTRAADAPLACEQLIEVYLTEFLILLCRKLTLPVFHNPITGSEPLLDDIIAYMHKNIDRKLSLNSLAEHFHVSRTHIKSLFVQYKQVGAIHFFIDMKIARAKEYLRESDYNVSQIAEKLGYDNVYYFCNQFKAREKMSPLEYRRSVTTISDKSQSIKELWNDVF